MTTYKTTLSIEPEVEVKDTDKFSSLFVGSESEFAQYMWTNDTIEDACEKFMEMLFAVRSEFKKRDCGNYFHYKFIEGFGEIYNYKGNLWRHSDYEKHKNNGEVIFYLPEDGELEVEWPCSVK